MSEVGVRAREQRKKKRGMTTNERECVEERAEKRRRWNECGHQSGTTDRNYTEVQVETQWETTRKHVEVHVETH